MLVEFGNTNPTTPDRQSSTLDAPAVTYVSVPDSYSFDPLIDPLDALIHMADNPTVTRLPDNEALVGIVHPQSGVWQAHSSIKPSWVWSDSPEFQDVLANYYGVDGRPDDVEDTHYTRFGPPGVGAWGAPIEMVITQNGRDIWARALGGGQVGTVGTTSATDVSTLTDSTATWTTNQWTGFRVVTGTVWGIVIANTSTVLTVDQWYSPANPSATPASIPTPGVAYVVMDGAGPAWFMGLSASTSALSNPSTNTTLPGELRASGGGLSRKICIFSHTASSALYSLTAVFTATTADSLPVTLGSIGVFNSALVSNTVSNMLLNSLFTTTIFVQAAGSQVTITDSVSGS